MDTSHGGLIRVDDPDDPRLVPFRRLNDVAYRRAFDAEHGLVVVEGRRPLERVLDLGVAPQTVLASGPRAGAAAELLERSSDRGAAVLVADPAVVAATVGFDLHRGLVATVACPRAPSVDAVVAGAQRLLVLEGVNDPENLGVIFRSAAALGADGVVVDPSCTDPWTRRVVRVSIGNVFALPWCRSALDAGFFAGLVRTGMASVALAPGAGAVPLGPDTFAGGGRVALLLGAEGPGLSPAVLAAADRRVRIPMRPGVDSLNVAVTAALALFATGPPR